jgi:hypothetical protein
MSGSEILEDMLTCEPKTPEQQPPMWEKLVQQ